MNFWTKLKVALAVEGFYHDRTFTDKTIRLDHNHYYRCAFYGCTVKYAGNTTTAIDCHFENSTILLTGRAAGAVQALAMMGYEFIPPPGIKRGIGGLAQPEQEK